MSMRHEGLWALGEGVRTNDDRRRFKNSSRTSLVVLRAVWWLNWASYAAGEALKRGNSAL